MPGEPSTSHRWRPSREGPAPMDHTGRVASRGAGHGADRHLDLVEMPASSSGTTSPAPGTASIRGRTWWRGSSAFKTRYIIAPNSNGHIALLVNMAKRAGLPWDAILGAEIARAYKPRPEVYLRCAEALGLAPSSVMMVAAHNSDLVTAAECGLQTAFVPRPTRTRTRPDERPRTRARFRPCSARFHRPR